MIKALRKTKTVGGVCDAFTKDLEDIRESQEGEANRLAEEIRVKQEQHEKATGEIEAAGNAIANIRSLFGGNTTKQEEI
jgi:hypothetical protein